MRGHESKGGLVLNAIRGSLIYSSLFPGLQPIHSWLQRDLHSIGRIVESYLVRNTYLRMTIGEALKYDLVALETGFYRLLPKLDVSGRPVIFCVPSTHTREGYTSESQVCK